MSDGLSEDRLFTLLSSSRRRTIIRYLDDQDTAVSLQDVVTHVAADEEEIDPDEVTDAQHKRVYVSLHQTHVPFLTDVGVLSKSDELMLELQTDERATEQCCEMLALAAGQQRTRSKSVVGVLLNKLR